MKFYVSEDDAQPLESIDTPSLVEAEVEEDEIELPEDDDDDEFEEDEDDDEPEEGVKIEDEEPIL